jgi:outer membrane protein OmpA-like peptidoglycan-associated protein
MNLHGIRMHVYVVVFVAAVTTGFAQFAESSDSMAVRYGAYVHAVPSIHSANFQAFEGVAFCCPEPFGTTVSPGVAVGGMTILPLSSWLKLDARVGLHLQSPTFRVVENVVVNDPATNLATTGEFEYSMNTSITAIDIMMMAVLPISRRLSINAGGRFQYAVSNSFTQTERILSPGELVFTDVNSNVRNNVEGSIPGINAFQLGPVIGLSYEIPVTPDGRFMLVPEISGFVNLGNYSSSLRNNGTWSSSGINAGVSLRFSPVPTVVPEEENKVIRVCRDCYTYSDSAADCIPARLCPTGFELAMVNGRCDCYPTVDTLSFVRIEGQEASDRAYDLVSNGVVFTEYRDSVYRPLLPYVFFKDSSSSEAYGINLSNNKSLKEPSESIEDSYKIMLDVVSKRLTEDFPDAVLTLQATTGGSLDRHEVERAETRANRVANYLRVVGKVKRHQIVIAPPVGMPRSPSTHKSINRAEDVKMENTRVELQSEQTALFLPIGYEVQRVHVRPEIITVTSLLSYRSKPASVLNMSTRIGNVDGAYTDFNFTYEEIPLSTQESLKPVEGLQNSNIVQRNINLAAELTKFLSGQQSQTSKTALLRRNRTKQLLKKDSETMRLKVLAQFGSKRMSADTTFKYRTVTIDDGDSRLLDTVTSVYSLILFDFNSAVISPISSLVLTKIKEKITARSTVFVDGYTDDIGDEALNEDLSRRRAESIAALLPQTSKVVVNGYGSKRPFTTNAEPWGRFFNRTVTVTIKTPK